MPLAIVKFPSERWRKVNVSRFLSRFKSIPASKIVEIPDEELDHVLEVLKRNNCEVEIVEPLRDDIEVDILKDLLKRIEAIRLGMSEPEELGKLAVEVIKKIGLRELSSDVAEVIHDCIDFAEHPLIGDLNDIEVRVREILREKLAVGH